MLVLAGAGSGKTRVVTQRIAHLINQGASSKTILSVTFTNKAAGEMRERTVRLCGASAAKHLNISTFHAFGLNVLKKEIRALGMRGKFALFDQTDAVGVVREILRRLGGQTPIDPWAVLERISRAKNRFLDPADIEELPNRKSYDYDELALWAYPQYIAAMRSLQAFDFDDLLCEVVRLWRRNPEVLAKWQAKFRYVLVDEYQDTNPAQLDLLRLLVEPHRNVCAVGDDDQAIYAWRGADVRNILEFERHFPGAKVIKLEHNFRSQGAVLDVARSVLEQAQSKRHAKTVLPHRSAGSLPIEVVAEDGETEAAFVTKEIRRLTESGAFGLKDIAVLYRSNKQSQEFEASLQEARIPFSLIGGTELYERKEVKDLLAYLRCMLHPRDDIAVRRVLNYPARGIGDASVTRLSSHAEANDWTLLETIRRADSLDLPPAAQKGCAAFVHILDTIHAEMTPDTSASQILKRTVELSGLREDLIAACPNPNLFQRRWSNIEFLLRFFDRAGNGRDAIGDLLTKLTMREINDDSGDGPSVTLCTMHGAKGLEFPVVFIVGVEEGFMPHARPMTARATDVAPGTTFADPDDSSDSLEEERRLFYVAVTRAKDQLYLCRAERRLLRGKPMRRTPSRFLSGVPATLLENKLVAREGPPAEVKAAATGANALLAALGGVKSA